MKHQVLLQIVGSVMLFVFGVFTFRSNPVRAIRPVSASKGTYLHNFVTAFFVTLSNPLIIFLLILPVLSAKRLSLFQVPPIWHLSSFHISLQPQELRKEPE